MRGKLAFGRASETGPAGAQEFICCQVFPSSFIIPNHELNAQAFVLISAVAAPLSRLLEYIFVTIITPGKFTAAEHQIALTVSI